MYSLVLILHSLLRWVVLGLGVWAFVRALSGWRAGSAWSATDSQAGRTFMMAADLQMLLGLVLWGVLSPYTPLGDMGTAMKDPTLRFWTVEHTALMLAAIVFVHVGKKRASRPAADARRHRSAALWFGLAVFTMLLATPWPFAPQARPWLRLP